jgi:2-keto-4-pentenoate hydratase/2-oxohepta-3-ene-1,7-dioic acid hydratase in catechol pathway
VTPAVAPRHIFNRHQLVSFISTAMTLLGVGPIASGDRLEVRIQGFTPLVNTVK